MAPHFPSGFDLYGIDVEILAAEISYAVKYARDTINEDVAYFPFDASGLKIPNQLATFSIHSPQPPVPTPKEDEVIDHQGRVKHWSAGLETPQHSTGFHFYSVKQTSLAPQINDSIRNCRLSRASVHAKGYDLFRFGVTNVPCPTGGDDYQNESRQ
jgi:hypothetical protein